MFRPASLSPRYRSVVDIEHIDISRKKHHGDDDNDPNDNGGNGNHDDHDHDSNKGGRRIKLVEHALKRRADELKNLQEAFTESLDGKRPLDPPTQFGTAVQRAWLHSVDPHDYRDQLEQQIDRAEMGLAKLEEKL